MQHQITTGLAVAAATTLVGKTAVAAEKPSIDKAALDKAFDTLKTFDWGTDRNLLKPIDEAVVVTEGDAAARKELETRLASLLKSEASRSAKDFVCRKLTVIGTAESVLTLAGLLPDKDLSHMARYALERISVPEAAQAMRDAVPKVTGSLKAGVIGSLGVRRDAASVEAIAAALHDTEQAVAAAAACALGNIGTPAAAKALEEFAGKAPEGVKPATVDGCLACAERLRADGKKTEATALYKLFTGTKQPKHVRLAATQGLASVAGKKE